MPVVWRLLVQSGVDLIGADDLDALRLFLSDSSGRLRPAKRAKRQGQDHGPMSQPRRTLRKVAEIPIMELNPSVSFEPQITCEYCEEHCHGPPWGDRNEESESFLTGI